MPGLKETFKKMFNNNEKTQVDQEQSSGERWVEPRSDAEAIEKFRPLPNTEASETKKDSEKDFNPAEVDHYLTLVKAIHKAEQSGLDPQELYDKLDAVDKVHLVKGTAEEFSIPEPHVKQFKDRIITLEELGEGAMGTAFTIFDTHLEKEAVVKMIKFDEWEEESSDYFDSEYLDSERQAVFERKKQRMIREAKSLGKLPSSYYLPSVYTGGTNESGVWVEMEKIEGETLHDRMENGELDKPEQVVKAMVDIVSGLKELSKLNLVHRDLKPKNIVFDETKGHYVLIDFGLAKSMGDPAINESSAGFDKLDRDVDLTGTGTMLGSPLYMSVEQVKGTEATVKSDIWAVGIMAYQLLAYKFPFEGRNASEVFRAILQNRPDELKGFRPDLPDELCDLIMDCFAKNPEDRPDPEEMIEVLSRLLNEGLPDMTIDKVRDQMASSETGDPIQFERREEEESDSHSSTTRTNINHAEPVEDNDATTTRIRR